MTQLMVPVDVKSCVLGHTLSHIPPFPVPEAVRDRDLWMTDRKLLP